VCSCPPDQDHKCSQKFIRRDLSKTTRKDCEKETHRECKRCDSQSAAKLPSKTTPKFFSRPALNVSNIIGKMQMFNENKEYQDKSKLPRQINPKLFHETQRSHSQNSTYQNQRNGMMAYQSLNPLGLN